MEMTKTDMENSERKKLFVNKLIRFPFSLRKILMQAILNGFGTNLHTCSSVRVRVRVRYSPFNHEINIKTYSDPKSGLSLAQLSTAHSLV